MIAVKKKDGVYSIYSGLVKVSGFSSAENKELKFSVSDLAESGGRFGFFSEGTDVSFLRFSLEELVAGAAAATAVAVDADEEGHWYAGPDSYREVVVPDHEVQGTSDPFRFVVLDGKAYIGDVEVDFERERYARLADGTFSKQFLFGIPDAQGKLYAIGHHDTPTTSNFDLQVKKPLGHTTVERNEDNRPNLFIIDASGLPDDPEAKIEKQHIEFLPILGYETDRDAAVRIRAFFPDGKGGILFFLEVDPRQVAPYENNHLAWVRWDTASATGEDISKKVPELV